MQLILIPFITKICYNPKEDRQRSRNKEINNSKVSASKHVSTATISLQQRNGVFYAVRAEMLEAEHIFLIPFLFASYSNTLSK
jgi:hypothetical protein